MEALLGEAEALGQADRIRSYVAEVRRRVATASSLASIAEAEAWASWALGEADRIDPVVSGKFLTAAASRVGVGKLPRQADVMAKPIRDSA